MSLILGMNYIQLHFEINKTLRKALFDEFAAN